jgi:hypothetical protein
LKTLPQISADLSTPIATLRYRIKPYTDFIPGVKTSKGMEYNEASEAIIGEINACYSTDMSAEAIRDMLSGKYARDIEVVPDTTASKTNEQQLIFNELMRFNDNMESLIERLNRQDDLQRQINEQGMAIKELSRVDKHKRSFWSIFKLWG